MIDSTEATLVRRVVLAGLILVSLAGRAPAQEAEPLYGFTPFPFSDEPGATRALDDIILPNSNLYAIHLDQCVPWRQIVSGRPFPAWLTAELDGIKRRIPPGRPVYVAVTPTASDRHSLAPTCGAAPGTTTELPAALAGTYLDHPRLQLAYVDYVNRIIDIFRPSYMNIGIEISLLALRHPEDWSHFGTLFTVAYYSLKPRHPDVQFGIELTLQSLQLPRVAEAVHPVAEIGDFIGISFYPYGTELEAVLGSPLLPPPPDEWRQPLEWLRTYTSKPIAICETGYASSGSTFDELGVSLAGSEEAQTEFLRDLVRYARDDGYLFVVWFVAVDFDRLTHLLEGEDALWGRIWIRTGLFDSDLRPKPAWSEWFSQSTR